MSRSVRKTLPVRGRVVCAAALVLTAAPALADTLVDNVNGMSVARDGSVTRFTGLVVGKDGKIVQLLKRNDKRPRTDYRVDEAGRSVIPGMIDSHVNLMDLGFTALTLDLSGIHSLIEAQAKIAEYASKFPDRAWIVGRGWDQSDWGLSHMPTAAQLDAAVSDRPVWLTSRDGHAGWANSKALALAGITAATTDPAGGRIERGAGGKAPAGVLVDQAMALVEARVPPPRPEDRDLAFATAQDILLKHGVTAVGDMGITIEDWQAYRRAGDADKLLIRIMAYASDVDNMALIGGPGPTPWLYDDRLRLDGLALRLDGALGSHGAWLKAPYADNAKSTGLQRLDSTQLRNLMSRAAIDNFQVAVEANGDAAAADVLGAIEENAQTYKGDRRWRVEHAGVVDAADVARFGKDGAVVSMLPAAVAEHAMAEARLGPSRLGDAYPWKSIAASGAHLAFGSGAPAEEPDPLAGIATAITREDSAGQPFGGWQSQEAVSREQAFAAYTSGAAYAGFADGRFGEIAPGQRADFVVLEKDPLLAGPDELRKMKPTEVWIGGRQVFGPAERFLLGNEDDRQNEKGR